MNDSKTYKFRVGVRDLQSSNKNVPIIGLFGANHACLLINEDIFEYGVLKTKEYVRHKNVGKDKSFDWDHLGETLNGISRISPDKLDEEIKKDGKWGPGHYNLGNHNCHHFVIFCLKKIGFPEDKLKKFFCLIRQRPGKVQIKPSFLYDDKSLDIRQGKMENGTEIILFKSHGRENQVFNMKYNSDDTVTFSNKEFAIEVKDGEAKSGAIIQISKDIGEEAQKFYLVNAGYGYFTIHSAINPDYVIAVHEEEKDNYKIQLSYYSRYSSFRQNFKLKYK